MHRRILFLLAIIYLGNTAITSSEARLIDGVFTEASLEPGYNLIATVPAGASNLNVTELKRTNNYLAVRLEDGRYLLNGNYSINRSGVYKVAGTSLIYRRQTRHHLESLTCAGALLEPIDLMLLYQEPNSGIIYRYEAPVSRRVKNNQRPKIASPEERNGPVAPTTSLLLERHRTKRKFAWRVTDSRACSKSCGDGIESRNIICVRQHSQVQVPLKRCQGLEKPSYPSTRCNLGPCPPRWRVRSWSPCSVSCGTGVRTHRELECVQEINNLLTVRVADGACLSETDSHVESCVMRDCEEETSRERNESFEPRWNVGEWSTCSVSCGRGERSRSVTCVTTDRSCSSSEKPLDRELCDSGHDCREFRNNSVVEDGGTVRFRWMHTEWYQQCSADCGRGLETRRVVCVPEELDGSNETESTENRKRQQFRQEEMCDGEPQPEATRNCSMSRTCGGRWFTGPWTQCSVSCGAGEQTRDAVCVGALQGSLTLLLDMSCPASKPETRRLCWNKPCNSTWFTSSWSQCSRSCGTGTQTRQVSCLNSEGGLKDDCQETGRPESKRSCNEHPCRSSSGLRSREVSTRSMHVERAAGTDDDEDCKDNTHNCALVAQARLCIYPFYQSICCASCSKPRRQDEE